MINIRPILTINKNHGSLQLIRCEVERDGQTHLEFDIKREGGDAIRQQ